MNITLSRLSYGYLITAENGRSFYVQGDYDYPGLASTFGWAPCHNTTDGTIRCPECGKEALDSIMEAQEYLDNHDGDTVDDPGYFDEE